MPSSSEFLHDFRVAVRKTRSLLAQIKGVLPAAAVEHFRKEFAWLGTVSGPCRDLDVFLLDLGRYEDALGDIHLARLRAFLLARLEVEHESLVAALDCNRYGELLAGWRPFLADGELEGQPPGARADMPAERVFGRRTWKLFKDVARNADGVDAGTKGEGVLIVTQEPDGEILLITGEGETVLETTWSP